ncbi:MAG: hypothetical protein KDD65_14260, partial [Bacteroidetes bacterium]|nr:hypothetical protein [Bacteroidota bacterium]
MRLWIDSASTGQEVVEVRRKGDTCVSTHYAFGVRFPRDLLGRETSQAFFDSTNVAPSLSCRRFLDQLADAGASLLPDRLPTSVSIGQHCPIVAYRLQMKADGAVHESRFWS